MEEGACCRLGLFSRIFCYFGGFELFDVRESCRIFIPDIDDGFTIFILPVLG